MRRVIRAGLQCSVLFLALCTCFALVTTGCSTTTNNGSCDAQGGGNTVSCGQRGNSSSPTASRQSSPPTAPGALTSPPPAASSAPPNGTQLNKYSFDLPNGYWAPLGITAPTRAQLTNQSQLDIQYNGEFYFGSNEQILALPNSSVPTYQACANNTQIENGGVGVAAVRSTAFCVVERGTIAGVEVGSVNNNPAYVVLNVTIWQNT